MKPIKRKHGQAIIYILLLAAVVAAMSTLRKCGSASPLAPITQGNSRNDTVDVAIIYGPLSYYIYNDTLGGMNLDMLKEFERNTGKNLKFWPIVNLHDALRKLEKGTYNMLASLPSDNSVKNRFITSRSVFLDRLVLIQASDSSGYVKIKSALDLASDTVYIQQDSPAALRLENLSNEIGAHIEVIKEKELSEEYLCMKVAKGEIGLAVVNENTARHMKERYPWLNYNNPVSFTQFQVWVIQKSDTALLHSVDRWLEEYTSTPQYKNLLKRYSP